MGFTFARSAATFTKVLSQSNAGIIGFRLRGSKDQETLLEFDLSQGEMVFDRKNLETFLLKLAVVCWNQLVNLNYSFDFSWIVFQ